MQSFLSNFANQIFNVMDKHFSKFDFVLIIDIFTPTKNL